MDALCGRCYRKESYGEETAEADARVIVRLESVAAGQGVTPAQVALAWLLQTPGVVSPVVGASKPRHLEEALAALEVQLAAEAVQTLEGAYVPHAVAGMARERRFSAAHGTGVAS